MDFVAYDLETTGIDTRRDHIIEIGAVRFEAFEETASFSRLVRPPVDIPPDAIRVHHITDEMVEGAPPVEAVLGDFAAFCGDRILVAHNAKFDFQFLRRVIKRHKARAPGGPTLDSKLLARKLLPGLPTYRLSSLMHHLAFECPVLHRAEEDARWCGLVFAELIRRLQRAGHPLDPAALAEMSEQPEMRFPRVAPSHDQLGLF